MFNTEGPSGLRSWYNYLVLYGVVPALLLAVRFLSAQQRNGLALMLEDPTISTVYTYILVHNSFGHFAVNIGMYLAAVAIIFYFGRSTKLFYQEMATAFLIMPFVSGLLTVWLYAGGHPAAKGFSAVVVVLWGYAAFLLFRELAKKPQLNTWSVKELLLSILLAVGTGWIVAANPHLGWKGSSPNWPVHYLGFLAGIIVPLAEPLYKRTSKILSSNRVQ